MTDEPLPEAQIEILLREAMAAAGFGNQQVWRLIVDADPALRETHGSSNIECGRRV